MKNKPNLDEAMESGWKIAGVWALAIVVCLAIWGLGAWVTNCFAHKWFTVGETDNAPALFGDSFGAVNALISAFAFAGMIVTFWLQRKELKLQRDELESQRLEFEQQNETLKLQRFENTFFNMMQLQQQIVNDLQITKTEREPMSGIVRRGTDSPEYITTKTYKGREVVEYLFIHREYGRVSSVVRGISEDLQTKGWATYNDSRSRTLLDHYFRHFYTILRFVDETNAFDYNEHGERDKDYEFAQKYHYATVLRATLSRYELVMLFYNGLSIFGRDRLKPLLEKYSILNSMNMYLLTLTKENLSQCAIPEKVSIREYLQEHGLTGTDYEFYITENELEKDKYHISAFCTNEEERLVIRRIINTKNVYLESLRNVVAE